MPATNAVSTGVAEDAWARTKTSLSVGVGAGRSSRTTGGVSARSMVTARIAVSLAAHEAAADDQLAGGSEDSERAPGHAQLAVVSVADGLDLQLAVDLAQGRVELERDLPTGGVQLPAHPQRPVVEVG